MHSPHSGSRHSTMQMDLERTNTEASATQEKPAEVR